MRQINKQRRIDPKRIKWAHETHNGEKGVVTGCDKHCEWMLEWWWDNYKEHNSYPVTWADFGMSNEAKSWCAKKGDVLNLQFKSGTRNWFKKPLAILGCVYERVIWTDLDCEIRSNLKPLFEYSDKFGVTLDPHTPWCKNNKPVASGVVSTHHKNDLTLEWAKQCMTRTRVRGDQEVLNLIISDEKLRKDTINIMPPEHQWLRIDGDKDGVIMMHWTGSRGKDIIRKQLGIRPRRSATKTKSQPIVSAKKKTPTLNRGQSVMSHVKNAKTTNINKRIKTLRTKYKYKP